MRSSHITLARARHKFIRSRGWKPARLSASLTEIAVGRRLPYLPVGLEYQQLGSMYAHPEYYDQAKRPTALVVHPYRHFSQVEVDALALSHGLKAEILTNPWYHPDAQTIVFYRRP